MNITKTILKRSLEIYKQDGIKGLLKCRTDYYHNYHPLRKNLYYWIYSKLKTKRETLKQTKYGFGMYLNLDDFGLSKQLWINGFREPECVKHYSSMLQKDDVVLDIGANIGYYVLLESKKVKTIFAFEPLPENMRFLTKNIIYNNIRNIELYPYAISGHDGQQYLFVGKNKNQANMFFGDGYISTECVTVDGFCKKNNIHPSVIRMDIEGFEYVAIDGMMDTLRSNDCRLFFEIHPYQMKQQGLDWEKPLRKLFGLGYKPMIVVKEHGSIREETFYCDGYIDLFDIFIDFFGVPDTYTCGFGLFMEKK